MEYRRLGRTDLDVSVVGLGALFLDRDEGARADAVVRTAIERGVNIFQFGHEWGENEQILARALRGVGRDRLLLCGVSEGTTDGKAWRELLEGSLRLHRTDHFDLYMFANVSEDTRLGRLAAADGALEALKSQKQAGRVRWIGAATHGSPEFVKRLIDRGEFDALMISYNAAGFHRESGHAPEESIARVETDILAYAAKRGVGVLAMKSLAGGLLASRITDPSLRAMVREPVSVEATTALRYVLTRPEVCSAVVGMTTVEEVIENCAVGDDPAPLTGAERHELEQAVASLEQRYCRCCHHCEPVCPSEIPIGRIFQWEALLSWPIHGPRLRQAYAKLDHDAETCTQCGECEKNCPYGIEIVAGLRRAHEAFSPHS